MKKIITSLSFLLLTAVSFAQYTAIPDANFENALAAYDDIPNDGQVPTANISGITYLNVTGENISDLTGIEGFTSLERLFCGNNLLTTLDVSQNTALYELFCFENQLTTLDLSQNPAMKFLNCRSNNISTLNITNNLILEELDCSSNQLTSFDATQLAALRILIVSSNSINTLDISQNILLTDIWCFSNQLNSLDVSSNLNLKVLGCVGNSITELDLSNNSSLIKLWAYQNNLTILDVRNGNNVNIPTDDFKIDQNPNLTCVSVDDVAYAEANWTNIDAQTSFELDCALSVSDFESSQISLYPNPATNSFKIESPYTLSSVVIYDYLGRVVANFENQTSYNVSNLNSGIYFVNVSSEGIKTIKKLIVK